MSGQSSVRQVGVQPPQLQVGTAKNRYTQTQDCPSTPELSEQKPPEDVPFGNSNSKSSQTKRMPLRNGQPNM